MNNAARFQTDLRVFQYHASVARSDAIGTSIRIFHRMLRERGIASTILCADCQFEASIDGLMPAQAVARMRWRPNDVLIVHYSFFDEGLDRVLAFPVRKILVYHNITPAHFFQRPGMQWLADLSTRSRAQLSSMRGRFVASVGDSQYNCDDLARSLHSGAGVIPVFFNKDAFAASSIDRSLYFHLKRREHVNLLFVGRFVPNKRHDLLVHVLAEIKALGTRHVTLHLVGKVWHETYLLDVFREAAARGVLASLQIHVDCNPERLKTLFVAADAFISMSEHEGFMVPILEAFCMGCPVIAAATSAVGETMGRAGIKIQTPNPVLAAGFVHLLRMDRTLRMEIIADQAARAAEFHPSWTFAKWIDLLGRFVTIEGQGA